VEISRETLLVVLAVAALAPVLADLPTRVRVPIVVTEIVAGIVVGPQVLDLARPDELLDALAELGLAFLFFMAGMEIDPARMRGRPAVLAARGWVGSLALGLVAALVLWAVGGIGAPVLVGLALTTTALGALVPILKDAGLAEHRVGRLALAGGAAGEFGPIVVLSIVLAVASGEPWRTVLLVVFAVAAVGAGLLATRARPPRLVRLVEATMHSSGQLALRLALLLLGVLVVLAGELGLDVVLGAFSAGFIVGLVARGEGEEEEQDDPFRIKLDGVGYGFLIPIFFINTGLGFDLDALLGSAGTLLLVPLFALLFLLARGLPTWLLTRAELPGRERVALALLTASALPLVVAITEVATEGGRLATDDAAALVGAAMLSLLLFPLVATALLRR
jgi:Kef-type K+ transport system membrane component KefB